MPLPNQDFEVVSGSSLREVFHYLYRNKNLIKVSAQDHEFESLLIIEDIEVKADSFAIKLGINEDLGQEIANRSPHQLIFDFNGPDQLPYQCEALLSSSTESYLWVEEPDHIRRYQLRHNFRIQAPRGAKLKATVDHVPILMEIINISLGGIFCHVLDEHHAILKQQRSIKNAELYLTQKEECIELQIQKVEMRRWEDRVRPGKFGVAYEFVKISRRERRKLIDQIYRFQREYLRNRLRI